MQEYEFDYKEEHYFIDFYGKITGGKNAEKLQ